VSPITWYALDATGNILEHCEAADAEQARLVFSVCCPGARFIQSKSSYDIARLERGIPKQRRGEEEED